MMMTVITDYLMPLPSRRLLHLLFFIGPLFLQLGQRCQQPKKKHHSSDHNCPFEVAASSTTTVPTPSDFDGRKSKYLALLIATETRIESNKQDQSEEERCEVSNLRWADSCHCTTRTALLP